MRAVGFFKILSFLVCLFAVTVVGPVRATAHPHVFITQQLEVIFDDKGMAGVMVHWMFDDMFASMIAEDHDRNKNGTLEPSEVKTVKDEAFSYIKEQNYFMHILIDGRNFPVKFVTDFNATLEDHRLTYDFFIPCHVTAIPQVKKIKISGYDPSYFSAVFFGDSKPVSIVSGERYKVDTKIKEDPDTKIYFDMVHPWTLFLTFQVKP